MADDAEKNEQCNILSRRVLAMEGEMRRFEHQQIHVAECAEKTSKIDLNNCSPLTVALLTVADPQKQVAVVRDLLDEEPDINEKDENGMTALMHAVTIGYPKTLQLLLDQDTADLMLKNYRGDTCLMLAALQGRDSLLEQLLLKAKSYGSEYLMDLIDTENNYGETAFTVSLKHGSADSANTISNYLAWALKTQSSLPEVLKEKGQQIWTKNRLRSRSVSSHRKPKTTKVLAKHFLPLGNAPILALKGDQAAKAEIIPFIRSSGSPKRVETTTSDSEDDSAVTNIRIKVGVKVLPLRLKQSEGLRVVHDRLNEKRNVETKRKVQELFRVTSEGNPFQTDAEPLFVRNASSELLCPELSPQRRHFLGWTRKDPLRTYGVPDPVSNPSNPLRRAKTTKRNKLPPLKPEPQQRSKSAAPPDKPHND